jgi:hypothetical protein
MGRGIVRPTNAAEPTTAFVRSHAEPAKLATVVLDISIAAKGDAIESDAAIAKTHDLAVAVASAAAIEFE